MKLLIVEDEIMLADSVKSILEKNGFSVECVYNGEDGLYYAKTGAYDLIISDVMMPKMNGYEMVKNIRREKCATPVLMLTALSDIDDEITGLNCGADYYLTKPFDSRKLLACVNALLRRQGNQVDELSLGNTVLDLHSSVLSCDENKVRLSSKEFDILRCLLSRKSNIVSKDSIINKVWGYDSEAGGNNVEVFIGLLRKKLKYIGSDIEIRAIRGLGYISEVSEK